MPPLSSAAFARRFRRLDAEERLRFVAELWAARGWTTSVEDARVFARDGDVVRRIRVFQPGFLRSPDPGDVDVLVVTTADEAVESRAAENAVRYVTPADLRDRLLYGMPREAGERLATEYLGRSLSATAADDAEDRSGLERVSSLYDARLRDRLRSPIRVAAVVLVVTVVGLAAAGPGLFPEGDAPSTVPGTNGSFTPGTVGALGSTATPDATGTVPGVAPGLSADEVTDVGALADATRSAMDEDGWRLRVYREGPDRTVWRQAGDRWRQILYVENETRYRNRVRIWYENENGTIGSAEDVYSDDATVYRRAVSAGGVEYSSRSVENAAGVGPVKDRVQTAILLYLSTNQTSVHCAGTLEGSDDCFAYQVTASGTPDYLPNVGNYRATATVSNAGLVTALHVEYTVSEPDGSGDLEPTPVRFGWQLTGTGDVDVSPPSWLPEAKSQAGDEPGAGSPTSASPTATPARVNASTEGSPTPSTASD